MRGRIVRLSEEEARVLRTRLSAQPEAGAADEVDWRVVPEVKVTAKVAISVRLDEDVLAFFRAEGRGYQTRMNAVLRSYMLARQGKGR